MKLFNKNDSEKNVNKSKTINELENAVKLIIPEKLKQIKVTTKNVVKYLDKIDDKKKNVVVPRKIAKSLNKLANKKHPKDENSKLINTKDYILEIRNATKYYVTGNVINKVLDNVSLDIKKGELLLIFGVSGGGKSTLLNIISGLDRPNSGDVIVCNHNLPYLSNHNLTIFRRDHVSFIFQSYNLLDNLNAYDNAESGAYLQKDLSKKIDIKELFEKFDLTEQMYKFPTQMSGGQQQRVSIIRALAKNADIVFADEPTGALDPSTTNIVLNTLYEINKKYGTTVIMVSHDSRIKPMADRIITIANGKIENIHVNEKSLDPKDFYNYD
ncbi:ABC transporter ATP-binding protein [Mycoplasmopsis meleagridis]|uniref:ABC transporter ATP-binding protein n=1 Tax=Mycoplasmopsis meleagridis TaxID=29561 RepID=UPI003A88ABEF